MDLTTGLDDAGLTDHRDLWPERDRDRVGPGTPRANTEPYPEGVLPRRMPKCCRVWT